MKLIKLSFPLILALMAIADIASSQDKNFKQVFLEAGDCILTEDFTRASYYYESLLKNDPENYNLCYLCGYCFFESMSKPDKAISYLEKAVLQVGTDYEEGSYRERNAPPEANYYLARAYHINNDFSGAIDYYEKFSNSIDNRRFADIEYVNNQIKSCEQAESMMRNPLRLDIQSAGEQINGKYACHNPVVAGNDSVMIYVVERPSNLAIMMSYKNQNQWSEPKFLNQELVVSGNFTPVSLSYDGTELYLVFTDYFESDIYVSHFRSGRWNQVTRLNKNINTRYYETHACVSRDGKTIYFTSDRKGGQGALDIYMAEREYGDDWGPAINLGPDINSYYNEESPFITRNDTRLYFSSQGHSTIGGYDVFYSEINKEGQLTPPENIGYPISTSGDDLFYNPGWDDNTAYYAMKIDSLSDQTGIYLVCIHPFEGMNTGMKRQDAVTIKSFSSSGIYYILNNILFDYEDYNLNEMTKREVERIFILMMKFSEIGIELTGHTDARESYENALKLSNERAMTVAQYLIGKGIDEDRILVMGIGEADPVALNQYEDGSDAPEGRKFNRHVSVKINNLDNEKIRVAEIFVPDHLTPKIEQSFTVLLARSKELLDTIPAIVNNEQTTMISTDSYYIYTAGDFKRKTDAIQYLNEIIDEGYPGASLIKKN